MYNAGTIGIKYMSPSSPTIAWFRNGVQIPLGGNTYPSIVDPTLHPNYGGFDSSIALAIPNAWPGLVSSCANGDSYYCTITNANGTVTSNTVTLAMGALAVPDAVTAEISPSTPVVMPEGGTLSFNAVSTSNQPVTYQWKKDGVPIVGATASAYSVVNAPTSASGAYTVVATSGTAIHETPATQVTVKQLAYGISNTPGFALVNSTITWQALGATDGMPGDAFTYYWEFDDGEVKIGNPVTKAATTVSMFGTVTATDTTTLGTATTTKAVRIAISWTTDTPVIPAYYSTFYGPSTVTLQSGDVLIIGSRSDNNTLIGNTSYIYSPLSHTLTQVGNIPASRVYTSGESALLLKDGRVLMTGAYISGSSGGIETKRTYIYSPATQTWSESGLRNYPCEYGNRYTSVLLPDGRVFSASSWSTSINNEIFDPSAGTWSTLPAQPVTTAYNIPSVCLMADGRVFRGPGLGDLSAKCVAYTPSTNSWTVLADCPFTKARIVAMLDGRLLGITLDTPTPNYSIYTPSTNTWSTPAAGPTISGQTVYTSMLVRGNEVIYMRGSASIAAFNGTSWYSYPTLNSAHDGAYIIEASGLLCCIGSKDGVTLIEFL
jgi:hypothetical protein